MSEETKFDLMNEGKNPKGLVMEISRTGDPGIYNEGRMSAFDPKGDCVADVVMGLDDRGNLRVLITLDGDGCGDHQLVVYPEGRKIEWSGKYAQTEKLDLA